jgi:hypothetical protein
MDSFSFLDGETCGNHRLSGFSKKKLKKLKMREMAVATAWDGGLRILIDKLLEIKELAEEKCVD